MIADMTEGQIAGGAFMLFGFAIFYFRRWFSTMTVEHQKTYTTSPFSKYFSSYEFAYRYTFWMSIVMFVVGLLMVFVPMLRH